MPTISSGHFENLKAEGEVEGVPTRWWLSRMTVEDGETNAIHVEQLIDGRWQEVYKYGRADTAASREGAHATMKVHAHARKKKIDHHEAKRILQSDDIDFRRDFFELSSSEVQRILEVAKLAGYRKRKDAPGSTARMYFQYLSRLS
jgi:hypothetical protein